MTLAEQNTLLNERKDLGILDLSRFEAVRQHATYLAGEVVRAEDELDRLEGTYDGMTDPDDRIFVKQELIEPHSIALQLKRSKLARWTELLERSIHATGDIFGPDPQHMN